MRDRAEETRATQLGFWLYALHLLTVFGIALSNALLALSLLWSPLAARRPKERLARATPLLVALALYLVALALSIALSYEPAMSLGSGGAFFNLTGILLGLLVVRGTQDGRRIVDGLFAVAGVVAAAGLGQYLLGFGEIDNRIRGPFSHYMTFSGFLLVCDLLLVVALVCGRGRRDAWRWVALLLINAALVGSLTRSAWVGLVVALTLLVVLRAPRLLLLYVPAGLVLVLVLPLPVLHRFASIADLQDRSNYDRLCMAQAGLYMISERPVTGLGPKLVEERYPIYRPPSAPRFQVPHLHNTFLQLAAESGLPILGAYLMMTGLALAAAWRSFRREGGFDGPRADLFLGVFLALVAFNVAGLFEDNWGDTEVQRIVLFLLILPFCLRREIPGGEEEPVADSVRADAMMQASPLPGELP